MAKFGAAKQFAPPPASTANAAHLLEIEAGGPDDGMDARLETGPDVVDGRVGGAEVDEDVRIAEHVPQLGVERRVGPACQLHVVGAVHRTAHGLPHPAGCARDSDADHAAATPGAAARLADRRHGGPEAVLTAADAGCRKPLGAVELGRELGQVVNGDRVHPGQHLIKCFDRLPEQGRA